ncbi:MAG: type II secretion system protein N [Sphingomonadaceae bacterium]
MGRLSPAFLRAVLAGLVLAALAMQCARLMWVILAPLGPVGEWRPASVTRSASDASGEFDPFFRLQPATPPKAVVTSLSLKLFGTRLDSAVGRGSAIIAAPDGVQSSYAVGDEIVAGVRLKSVAYDSVTIDRGGVDEQLFLDQSVAAPVASPNGAAPPATPGTTPSAAALQASLDAAPRLNGSTLTGLTLNPKGDGKLFDAAGLKAGDVLTAVNGKAITSASDFSQVVPAADGTVSLQVERAGRTMTLSAKTTP